MKYHIESNFKIKKELPVSKIREIEVEILRAFVKFCDENGLRYYLVGGTLIGAVRHQGFVPWDDDLDVAMPRKDFMKFRELTMDGKFGEYEIRSIIHTPDIHPRPFDRIVDTRYMTMTNVDQTYIPPWLDVHAFDGLPADEIECSKHWDKAGKLKKGSKISRTPLSQVKGIKRKIKHLLLNWKIIAKGPTYYAQQLIEHAMKYDFETSENIASVVAGYGRKEQMPKYYFTDGEKKMYFEGILCCVPPHYDKVLTHMYGNYLQLPSDASKTTHIEKLWEVVKK